MNIKPILSIVVPTKDRYYYLKLLIQLIDSFKSKEIELVVQDNTSNNSDILEYMNSNSFSFVKYYHKSEKMDISSNCDMAILNASGEYICLIGDDDGVTRHIIECAKWMKINNIEVLIPSKISYSWPDRISKRGLNYAGKIIYNNITGDMKEISAYNELYKLIKKGFINRGNLPLTYHGIVKRDLLEKIYKIGNTYFPGPSPDIANGIALSLLVNKYIYINMPIIISGASKYHGGGIHKLKNRAGNIEDILFLPKNTKENWEQKIPKIWTGETISCESAIKALRYMKREDLIKEINYEYMYIKFITFHYYYRSIAYKLSNNRIKLFIDSWISIIIRYINAIIRKSLLMIGRYNNNNIKNGIIDIISAERIFKDYRFNINKYSILLRKEITEKEK